MRRAAASGSGWDRAAGAAAAAALAAVALGAWAQPARAQAPATTDVLVDARVLPDGRVAVTVDRAVAFASASSAPMRLSIPLEGAAGAEILEVGEPGRHYRQADDAAPFVYARDEDGDEVVVRWGVEAAAGETRRFIVTYLLDGAIDVDPRGDALSRTLLPPGEAAASATVRVAVPPGAEAVIVAEARRLPGGEALALERQGDTAVRTAPASLGAGEGIAVTVSWPTGAVPATPRAGAPEGARAGAPRPLPPIAAARADWPALGIAYGLVGAIVGLGALFGLTTALLALRAAADAARRPGP